MIVNSIAMSRDFQKAGMERRLADVVASAMWEYLYVGSHRPNLDKEKDAAEMSGEFQKAGMEKRVADAVATQVVASFCAIAADEEPPLP